MSYLIGTTKSVGKLETVLFIRKKGDWHTQLLFKHGRNHKWAAHVFTLHVVE